MPMLPPEPTTSATNGLLQMKLSTSSSDCSGILEEKKSMEEGEMFCFQKESTMDKQRERLEFRNQISNEPGSKFLAEPGRYVLYVSRACPQSHTALLVRTLKGLEDVVSVKYVKPHPDDHIQRNWMISHQIPDDSFASLKSEEGEFACIRDIYQHEHDNLSNSIPLLYDQDHQCIVNNNSHEIASMLNSVFNGLCKSPQVELFPGGKAEEDIQQWLYPLLQLTPSNLPPYHYNLSPRQLEFAFERATHILQKQRYLLSHTEISAADLRLFATLIRYDAVYSHYLERPPQLLHNPVLLEYCRTVYHQPGVAATVRMDEIQTHFLGKTGSDKGLVELLEAPPKHPMECSTLDVFPMGQAQMELQNWLYPLLQLAPSNLPQHYHNLSAPQLELAVHRATSILQKQRYLLSRTKITAVDHLLLAALIQYDVFCAQRSTQLVQNPALMDYCRDIYQQPGVAASLQTKEIRACPEGAVLLQLLQAPHKRQMM